MGSRTVPMSTLPVHVQRASPPGAPQLAAGPQGPGLGHLRELVIHLVVREVTAAHRWTILGWSWPLIRQIAQLAVLVLIFGHVVDLHIPDYPVFVFTGLIAWTWFSTGVGAAAWSVIARRHLVLQPRCPPAVLPVVAVLVPLVDFVLALPVLLAMLLASGTFHATILLLPALLCVQLLLMVGLGWLTAALSVYLRDVPNIVTVALMILFYATPVFFSVARVPHRFQALLLANPIGTLIESYRAIMMGGRFPPVAALAWAVGASLMVAAIGLWCFQTLKRGFVDEL
jgi:homopolymeric O-antigen transport system permease protein